MASKFTLITCVILFGCLAAKARMVSSFPADTETSDNSNNNLIAVPKTACVSKFNTIRDKLNYVATEGIKKIEKEAPQVVTKGLTLASGFLGKFLATNKSIILMLPMFVGDDVICVLTDAFDLVAEAFMMVISLISYTLGYKDSIMDLVTQFISVVLDKQALFSSVTQIMNQTF